MKAAAASASNYGSSRGNTMATSAYLTQCRATKKTANFWGELTRMAEKAGKIEHIDAKFNPLAPTANVTSIDTRPRAP